MADLAPVPPEHRKKMTVWLIAGGVASLLLPLLAAIYLRMNESSSVPGPSGRSDLFERREDGEVKLTPTPMSTPTTSIPRNQPMAAPGSSSLDFIKTSDAMQTRASTPPKAASAPVAAQAPAAEPQPAPTVKAKAKTTAKNAKKAFSIPKLQPSKWSSNFSKRGKEGKKAAGGGQDMSEMLKQLPPGAENNPQIQELLKK